METTKKKNKNKKLKHFTAENKFDDENSSTDSKKVVKAY